MIEREGLVEKADRFLASAELLIKSGDLDSAVSRIYYATFFAAEALLDALGLSFSSHKEVLSAYGREFAKTGKLDPHFHRFLITAFGKRQQADYWVNPGFDTEEVESLLREAREFVDQARTWLTREGFLRTQGGPE